jgi:predicted PurR-regulated permease PerM
MDEKYLKKITTAIILLILLVLAFFLVRPILLAIIMGLILAFIFSPVYDLFYKYTKSKNFSALLICFILLIAIIIPLWFLTPVVIDQSIKIYTAAQQIDFITPLKNFFPELFVSEDFSAEIGSTIYSFVTKITSSLMTSLSQLILNFAIIFLQMLVVFFVLFFVLKDKEELVKYIQSLLPFSKEIEKKLFKSSKDITVSVLYGQVVIGIMQGIIVGIGLFIFKIPNALLLTFFAALAGIFPIIGTALVWVPVVIYLLIAGDSLPAIGIAVFGLCSSLIENMVKPVFVSKRTNLNTSLILIGMVGGLLLFGILGIILGPLILAYLLIVLELYRKKGEPSVFVQEPSK